MGRSAQPVRAKVGANGAAGPARLEVRRAIMDSSCHALSLWTATASGDAITFADDGSAAARRHCGGSRARSRPRFGLATELAWRSARASVSCSATGSGCPEASAISARSTARRPDHD